MSKTYARIIATGSYLPENKVDNHYFADYLDTSDEWIFQRSGIKCRHFASSDQKSSDLGYLAAQDALSKTNLNANDLDMIIVATTTADKIFPATACTIQKKLGITNQCPAFDLQAVCSGFVYGLTTATQYIETGFAQNILVIGAETISHILDKNDRTTAVLFGDGAGAVIVQASDKKGIITSKLHAEGYFENLLHVPDHSIKMEGKEVFKIAVEKLGELLVDTLKQADLKASDLDWFIPHQANIRIIQSMAKRLKLPCEKVITTIAHHGNTSAASVPLALDLAVSDGRVKKDDLVLLEAMGGGFTWGSVLLYF